MELGGNAPFVVLADADLDAAVEGAMVAKMRNGGSACTAANRFFVHASLADEFAAGSPSDEARHDGTGRRPVERARRPGLAGGARQGRPAGRPGRAEGATLTLGGETPAAGAFYPPTVLTDVRHGSEINQTEIFGPVTAIVSFSDVDEAIAMANDTIYGLIAYVYGDPAQALAVAQQIDAGMVAVNRGVLSDPAAPFGGTKQSGLGREGSSEGILEFLEEKYIGIEV